jgi:hypothetical protein
MGEISKTGLRVYQTRNSKLRERIQTILAHRLMKLKKPLWYLETLVLSARYFQRINQFASIENKKKTMFLDREALWNKAVIPYLNCTLKPIHVAEFGVAWGKATQWWHDNMKNISRWDGFDTFEGLPTPWMRAGVNVMNQGVFAPKDLKQPFPQIDGAKNIIWHKGLIGNTINMLERNANDTLLVLIDVDLLEPTRDVLKWMLANGATGDCVYFDEAFDPFNEGLALSEAVSNGLQFNVLGFTGSALAIVLQ